MNAIFDVLHARRPPINYVSPPVCEALASGSGALGELLILLNPFGRIPAVGGLVVFGEFPGPFSLTWNTTPGDGPPIICYNIYQVVDGNLILVSECVTPPTDPDTGVPLPPGSPGGGDTYVVTPVTTEGEGPPSPPITTPVIPPVPPEPPLDCGTNPGEDTTCVYGPVGEKYRIKNYNPALFDISICGLTFTNCINCEVSGDPGENCVNPQEWTGSWPVKVNDAQFIDQEFVPDSPCGGCPWPHAHLLQGFCISSQLVTSSAFNSTGCGWRIDISFGPTDIWTGVKDKGEGPTGKYFRISGCSPGPECMEVEAY